MPTVPERSWAVFPGGSLGEYNLPPTSPPSSHGGRG